MTSKTLSDVVRPVVIEHLGDAPGAALPHVIETLNSYLEAATDAVCNGGVLDALLGDLEQVPDTVLGPVSATLVAAYLQGAAVLHAAMMQGDKHAND